jgi:hypothetical protein
MVEFALVVPVFLAALWALVNGGLLLYSVNATGHALSLGANSIAASGNDPDADVLGIQRMAAAGLTTTLLTTVSEVDVEELEDNPVQGGFCVYGATGCPAMGGPSGSPVIATGCSGARGAFAGSGDCVDRYAVSPGSTAVTALDPWSSCSQGSQSPPDVSQCPPWAPEARSVTDDAIGQSAQGVGTSYVAVVVHYRYALLGMSGGVSLTATSTFRLEPRT